MSARAVQLAESQILTAAALLESKPVHMKTLGVTPQLHAQCNLVSLDPAQHHHLLQLYSSILSLKGACYPCGYIERALSYCFCIVYCFRSFLVYTGKQNAFCGQRGTEKHNNWHKIDESHGHVIHMLQLTDLQLCPTSFNPSTKMLRQHLPTLEHPAACKTCIVQTQN